MHAPTIHLVNPLWNGNAGSELRTLNLYRALKPHCEVILWSEAAPHADIAATHAIRRIDVARGEFPRGGTLVFVGVYFPISGWLARAAPDRVIVVYNTNNLQMLARNLLRLRRATGRDAEIVYASAQLAAVTGLPGTVETSLIDIARFAPAAERKYGRFRVGRLSRTVPEKHYPRDIALYWRLAARGCEVVIMGPDARWTPEMTSRSGLTLLAPGEVPADTFLQGLDCFLYRTAPHWPEPWGRVVCEAMACALPVVVHRSGGYSTLIEHGRNGFLFDTREEALRLVLQLKDDPELQRGLGEAGRATIERLFSEEARSKIVDFYLR